MGSQAKRSLLKLPREFLKGPSPERKRLDFGSEKALFVGVDGGATKTLAMVSDEECRLIGLGSGGPSNRDAVGPKRAVSSIRKALQDALGRIKMSAGDVKSAVLAVAGVHTDPDKEWFSAQSYGFGPGVDLYVQNDVVAAWAAGTLCKPGIAIIGGTGSNGFGVNSLGQSWRAGGWGHTLGDEGSAYWIGLTAIREALRFFDGRGPQTRLVDRVLDFYDLKSVESLPALVYDRGLAKDEIAGFAVCVCEEAEKGDKVAVGIFRQAGIDLGLIAASIAGKLRMQNQSIPVALIGSVFDSGSLVTDSFESTLRKVVPKASVVFPDLLPVAGALLLAAKAAGCWSNFELEELKSRLRGHESNNGPLST